MSHLTSYTLCMLLRRPVVVGAEHAIRTGLVAATVTS